MAVRPLWTQLLPVVPGSEAAWSAALAEAAAAGLAAAEVDPALQAAQALASDELEKAVAEAAFARAEGLAGALRVDVFLTLAAFFDAGKTRDPARRARALALATTAPGAPPRRRRARGRRGGGGGRRTGRRGRSAEAPRGPARCATSARGACAARRSCGPTRS